MTRTCERSEPIADMNDRNATTNHPGHTKPVSANTFDHEALTNQSGHVTKQAIFAHMNDHGAPDISELFFAPHAHCASAAMLC